MDIKTTPLTVSQLLHGSNEQFVIPPYQRRYSWLNKQIIQLFDDIKNLSDGETHFLGSIVCLTESHTAGVNLLELVDGQQRMTTLILVLDTIKDKFEELEDQREADRIEDLVTCNDIDRKRISKIILGDLDDSDFKIIINQSGFEQIKNRKLLEAYQMIKGNLDQMTTDELNKFKEKLINQTNIVRLDVSRAKDAFKLFETINNRGLSLSPTDIIKNFLLGHASLIDDETLRRVKEEWTKIIVNMDGQNLDDFFRQYLSGKLGNKVSFTFLTDYFKKYYINKVSQTEILAEYQEFDEIDISEDEKSASKSRMTPIEFLRELQNSSQIYAKILNRNFDDKKINDLLYNLQRIKSFPSYTFILDLMKREVPRNDKLEILRLIEVFMIRRNICEYRTSELDDIFSKLVKLPDEELVLNVKNYLAERLPTDQEFESKILTHDFYGQYLDRAKCMLEAIEYKLSGNTEEKFIGSGEDVHLEHIIPQTITTKKSKEELGDWEKYLNCTKEEHQFYVSKLGNMTLLSGKKNIIASNNPFSSKREIYEGSEIKLTHELSKLDDFKFKNVDERSKKLAKESVKIWSF
jgi:uncharacterized protein with ParB-like and HNH nuclease domain